MSKYLLTPHIGCDNRALARFGNNTTEARLGEPMRLLGYSQECGRRLLTGVGITQRQLHHSESPLAWAMTRES